MRRSAALLLSACIGLAACGAPASPTVPADLTTVPAISPMPDTAADDPAWDETETDRDDTDPSDPDGSETEAAEGAPAVEADEPAAEPAPDEATDPALSPEAVPVPEVTAAPAPKADFTAFARGAFFAADTNRNGRVSKKELKASVHVASLADEFHWSFKTLRGWDYPTFESTLRRALATNPDLLPAEAPAQLDRNPVLLVQGWGEPSYYLMYGIARHLRKQGIQTYGINLFPNVTFSETQASKLEAKIKQILAETGAAKIDLVCHSFGGLISRRYIQMMGGDAFVDRYVSVATPHNGTRWCDVVPGGACEDMDIGSRFLTELNRLPLSPGVKWHCIWTKYDEIVIPQESAILPGANVYPPVPFSEHGLILWHPKTYGYIDQALAS